MNRTRTRALLAAAALGVATIALPIAASAQSETVITVGNGLTCKKAYPALEMVTGPVNGTHGTMSYSGNTLTYDLVPGWTLDLCLKGANNVEYTAGITGSGAISLSIDQGISHIGYRLTFLEPSDDDGDDDGGNDDAIDDGDDGDDDGTSNDDDGDTDSDDGETDGADDGTGPDDGITDDGSDDAIDDGTDDGVSNDDGETDGTDADGTDDGVSNDDGETDGTDADGTDADGTDADGTDDDGTDDDGTDADGTDDDGTDVLPGGEVAPVDGDGDDDSDGGNDGAGADGAGTAEVPVEVLPATLDSRLPNTGSDLPALLVAGALALGLGGTTLVRTRRRTTGA